MSLIQNKFMKKHEGIPIAHIESLVNSVLPNEINLQKFEHFEKIFNVINTTFSEVERQVYATGSTVFFGAGEDKDFFMGVEAFAYFKSLLDKNNTHEKSDYYEGVKFETDNGVVNIFCVQKGDFKGFIFATETINSICKNPVLKKIELVDKIKKQRNVRHGLFELLRSFYKLIN